jgi:hypothetical protein
MTSTAGAYATPSNLPGISHFPKRGTMLEETQRRLDVEVGALSSALSAPETRDKLCRAPAFFI